jgi:hypothetical protein
MVRLKEKDEIINKWNNHNCNEEIEIDDYISNYNLSIFNKTNVEIEYINYVINETLFDDKPFDSSKNYTKTDIPIVNNLSFIPKITSTCKIPFSPISDYKEILLDDNIKKENENSENNNKEIKNERIDDEVLETNIEENIIIEDNLKMPHETQNHKNNDIPFLSCPIVTINNKEDMEIDWKQHVSTEIFRVIKDNKELFDKIKKDDKICKKTLNGAIDYILQKKNIKNIGSNRKRIRYSILRSCTLYEKYDEKLKYINFSFDQMIKLNKKEWKLFLEYINIEINKIPHDAQNNEEPSTPIIDNKFNYNYILNNKKGFLFNENDKLYTYDLYEMKIIANNPDGIFCDYCGYTRYNSSPCIFRNCKNRKYGDDEFKIYKKIYGREMESKYNKNYVNNNLDITSENEDSEDQDNSSNEYDFEDELEN